MRRRNHLVLLAAVVGLLAALLPSAASAAPATPVTFTILHTNDFHGQLEPADPDPNKISTPGMARTANVINKIRAANTAAGRSTLLVDAGDEMQGSLLSNLGDGTPTGKGAPTIGTFNAMGYVAATFGNHEFDWGQVNLANRTGEATYPFVTANIVKNDTGDCATAGWSTPDFADAPYVIKEVGAAPNLVKVAFIGVTTTETPIITVATATAGLCFKDPTQSILHYYDEMKGAEADVIVVLSHLGYADGGYGYGIPVIGDQTLAANLIKANKPANLIIGGHSHTSVAAPGTTVKVDGYADQTIVVQSAYNGRRVGQADVTVAADGSVSIGWKVTVWTQKNTGATPPIPNSVWRTFTSSSAFTEDADVSKDPAIDALISEYASDPDYLALVNTPVGYSAVDLPRNGGVTDNMMATFIDDAIYEYLNTDGVAENDVDAFFNNAGGIRSDWCYVSGAWQTSGCATGTHEPGLLNYGHMFTILPFGNATVVGDMTGAQILEVLNKGAQNASNTSSPAGAIQPAGVKYRYFAYRDANPGPQPWAWGAFDYCVVNRVSEVCEPLDLKKTYRVGTNEFLAPGGGDGYGGFKYMTDVTYWGDMLNAVNAYVAANYGTVATAYNGPNGDGSLDGRIVRDGDNTSGSIIPVTILHHNDSHGNLFKNVVSPTTTYVGYTQLATLIKQERLHNPTRTLLVSSGDNIQGDAMMYYYKSAPLGYAADGTQLTSPPQPQDLTVHPMMAVMNALAYDAWTIGNHEFNFGKEIFTAVLSQATFPTLQANVSDDGQYGLDEVPVEPYTEKTVGPEGIKVAILGIGNHRVPNYELPSNIPGLTFSDPLVAAQQWSTKMRPIQNLEAKVKYFYKQGSIKKAGVRNSLLDKLAYVESYIDADNTAAAVSKLKAFVSEVKAQKGKAITVYAANTLISLATWAQTHTYDDDLVLALTHIGFTENPGSIEVDANVDTNLAATVRGIDAIVGGHSHTDPSKSTPASGSYKYLPAIVGGPGNTPVIINHAYRYNSYLGELILGFRATPDGYEVVSRAGQYLAVTSTTPEDTAIKAIVDPYAALLKAYNDKVIGQTTVAIDALKAYTEETNAANLQADASVYELTQHGIAPDFHLSGAMANRAVATSGPYPVSLKVSDMFSLMPYENSLVVLNMNGPQLKAVLERAYRNYYYYKYVPGYGGYSYYTTCMLDTNEDNVITYDEKGTGGDTPPLPDGSNVVSLVINGVPVDFGDAAKYYKVSTVNYLAAGSCNFNNNGVSLWPLGQIANDTQYYVRDAVINYIDAMDTVSPAIEGRLVFIP